MLHNMLRAAAGRDRIPTDGLVAWYTMDNISGSTLVDEMGNYDGTITGATQTPGVIGQSLNFDGNGYVTTGPVSQSIYAVSLWLYSEGEITSATSGQWLIDLDDGTNDFQSYIAIGSSSSWASSEVVSIGDGDSFNRGRTSSRTNIAAGWNNIVINWNGSRYDIVINDFLNVVYEGSDIRHCKLLSTGVDLITMGKWNQAPGYELTNKKLDSVRFYSRSLTESEITAIYNEGA